MILNFKPWLWTAFIIMSIMLLQVLTNNGLEGAVKFPEAKFESYSPELFAEADKDKPIVLLFTADWCVFCTILEKAMKRSPLLMGLLQANEGNNFIIDGSRIGKTPNLRDLMKQYKVSGYPTIIVINTNGTIDKLGTGNQINALINKLR